MAVSGVASAGAHAASQHTQSLAAHSYRAPRHPSNTDIDAGGSSVAAAPSPTGKTASKVDITV